MGDSNYELNNEESNEKILHLKDGENSIAFIKKRKDLRSKSFYSTIIYKYLAPNINTILKFGIPIIMNAGFSYINYKISLKLHSDYYHDIIRQRELSYQQRIELLKNHSSNLSTMNTVSCGLTILGVGISTSGYPVIGRSLYAIAPVLALLSFNIPKILF